MLDEMEISVPEAATILRDLLVDHRYRDYPVGQAVQRYVDYMRHEFGATERTIEDYSNILDKLALTYPDFEIADFDVDDLRWFVSDRWGGVSASTRGKVVSVLKSFFRWALESDLIDIDPASKLRRPRRRGVARHAHDPRLIHALIEAQLDRRDRVAISMMARLGLRKNELRTLQWAGVDLERREIRIHGKGGKIADIPIIYDDLLAELAQLRDAEAPAPEDYLLYPVHVGNVRRGGAHLRGIVRSDRNQPMQPSTMHRWWKRCLGRADAPDFPMHELRHTAGTEFMRATGDLKLTQMFMRHASISTTADVYLHLDRADLIVGMKKAQERWQRQIDQEDKDEG